MWLRDVLGLQFDGRKVADLHVLLVGIRKLSRPYEGLLCRQTLYEVLLALFLELLLQDPIVVVIHFVNEIRKV